LLVLYRAACVRAWVTLAQPRRAATHPPTHPGTNLCRRGSGAAAAADDDDDDDDDDDGEAPGATSAAGSLPRPPPAGWP
jgi:hypothetical protein